MFYTIFAEKVPDAFSVDKVLTPDKWKYNDDDDDDDDDDDVAAAATAADDDDDDDDDLKGVCHMLATSDCNKYKVNFAESCTQ